MKNLKLSDVAIGQIVQLLQMGILTGTDISDHIRMLRLDVSDGTGQLVPSTDFLTTFNENLKSLEELAVQEAHVEE